MAPCKCALHLEFLSFQLVLLAYFLQTPRILITSAAPQLQEFCHSHAVFSPITVSIQMSVIKLLEVPRINAVENSPTGLLVLGIHGCIYRENQVLIKAE